MRFWLLAIFTFFIPVGFAGDFTDNEHIPDWAQYPISVLEQEEVISGNDDGSFAPERAMNRAEFCKVIVNATGVDKYLPLTSHFPDIERDDWFFDFVETAKYYGWIDGYPDGTFRPGNKINRAEAAKILANAFDLPIPDRKAGQEWSVPYFEALSQSDLLAYGSSLDDKDAGKNPHRAEISEQIFRLMKHTGRLSPFALANYKDNYTPPSAAITGDNAQQDSLSNNATSNDITLFEYTEKDTGTVKIEAAAGDLHITKNPSLPSNLQVSRGRKGVKAHSVTLSTKNGSVKIGALKFRRTGTGISDDFIRAWLEIDGDAISPKIILSGDIINIPFHNLISFGSSPKTIDLKVDAGFTTTGSRKSRFVLFLPEWIDANTKNKIGFFPLGGTDISIK